ncbi:MAG: DUF3137 domain-containing protein, partial [Campylobacter sp.]|nr:DUF3137 domain-containing protein [Campylobacter sp.]
ASGLALFTFELGDGDEENIREFASLKKAIIILLLAALFIFFVTNVETKFPYLAIIVMTKFIILAIYPVNFKASKKDKIKKYRKTFKLKYLKPLFLKAGYEYEVKGSIGTKHLRNSLIFAPDEFFDGDDKISGSIENIKFALFDIMFKNQAHYFPTFGIFFYAEFNKKVKSTTFITTKKYKLQDYGYVSDKIAMDDTKFNELFDVYSNDMQNAMYILSPAFMKRLLDLKRRLNFPISVSFVGDKIYIFLDTGKDNFEPDIDKSVLHANPAFTIKRELSHFLSIVKTLNLNTKIWKV